MSLLVYAVTDAPAASIGGAGIDQRPLRALGAGGLAAVVSDHDRAVDATAQALWEYGSAVERLMERHTILPARFGSTLPDERAALTMLRSRDGELRLALEQVAGTVELGLRVEWVDGAQGDAVLSGRDYMLERLGLYRRAQELGRHFEPLAGLARASRRRILPERAVPLLAAYLVVRDRVEQFVALVSELDNGVEDVAVSCTGPWPPYSFVNGAPS